MEALYTLPPRLEASYIARRSSETLRDVIPEDLLDDVKLLVGELVANSLTHAELRPEDSISLALTTQGSRLRVEVGDPGSDGTPRMDTSGLISERGRGLLIVDHVADAWGVESGERTLVWFEIDLRRSSRVMRAG